MRRALGLLAFSLLLAPLALGAELTNVADAFDDDDPFDLNIDVGYVRYEKRAKLTGEQEQAVGSTARLADLPWLRYTEYSNKLVIKWAFGVYQDVEIHGNIPIEMCGALDCRTTHWRYALQFRQSVEPFWRFQSSQANVDVNGDGQTDNPTSPVPTPGQSFRGGMQDPTFGIAWGILNDARDPTKPSWVVGVDFTPGLVRADKPTIATTASNPGAVGDKVHRLKFTMGLSKRSKIADPYFQLHYTMPILTAGAYDPCKDDTYKNFGGTRVTLTNCNAHQDVWKDRTSVQPPHVGGFIAGTELIAYDEPQQALQKISFDLRFSASYISEARTYSELSDALKRLTFVEQYVNLEALLGFYVTARYFHFNLSASLGHDTQHLVTGESLGRDVTPKGQPGEGLIELSTAGRPDAPEQNPLYDFRLDTPGRRVRITETSIFKISATGAVTF